MEENFSINITFKQYGDYDINVLKKLLNNYDFSHKLVWAANGADNLKIENINDFKYYSSLSQFKDITFNDIESYRRLKFEDYTIYLLRKLNYDYKEINQIINSIKNVSKLIIFNEKKENNINKENTTFKRK